MSRGRPCRCDRIDPTPGATWTDAQCKLCWLFHHDDQWARQWTAPATLQGVCDHRSSKAHRWIKCGCPSGMAVFECHKLSAECVEHARTPDREDAVADEGLVVCSTCPAKQALFGTVSRTASYPCRFRQKGVRLHDAEHCDGTLVEVFTCDLMNGKECSLETQVPGAALCAACAYRAPVVASDDGLQAAPQARRGKVEGRPGRVAGGTVAKTPSKMVGVYGVGDERGQVRRVRLAPQGAVNGNFRGASRWHVAGGLLVLARADGQVVSTLRRAGKVWQDDALGVTAAMLT